MELFTIEEIKIYNHSKTEQTSVVTPLKCHLHSQSGLASKCPGVPARQNVGRDLSPCPSLRQ